MEGPILPALMTIQKRYECPQDSKVMESTLVKVNLLRQQVSWGFIWVVILGFAAELVVMHFTSTELSYMDSEIRAIMAQYMPLDNQGEVPSHLPHGDI
ncbi:Vacuolar-sorting receptor 4 [Camellia lanceoleosa]|uniref:Vacuolar-sorting receptor 4 n=1 Tax=Camellia lanceoleosa TaxID=1840588 RepID=A0ACC0HRV5_9ERIC|nr:Vacuolar-sorting receptor 4 [Camellia lanceoleosa]